MELNKETLYWLLHQIKNVEGKRLKTRIWKSRFMPSGSCGEYETWSLAMATGEKTKFVDWRDNIAVLAHEYSHHLCEKGHKRKYNNKLYIANYFLYDQNLQYKERKKYANVVMLDEYWADSCAYERVLKKWKLQEFFPEWWYGANCYNLQLKYYSETGTFYEDYRLKADLKIPVSNKKLNKKELLAPLTKWQKATIDKLILNKELPVSMVDYKSV